MLLKTIKRIFALFSMVIASSAMVSAETVGVFFDANVEQIKFAAGDVKVALESKGLSVNMLPISSLTANYPNPKVVIALSTDTKISRLLTKQGGKMPTGLGEQAYGLQTTQKTQQSHWVIGGDANGAMYGGFQIAENIKFSGFSSTYNIYDSPSIQRRGIKLNIPLDKVLPTYGKNGKGDFAGTSPQKAIPHVWDSTFWFTWFDEMARNRYNTLSIWLPHAYPALIKVADYPDVAINNITGFDGYTKPMTIEAKIEFWKKVMAYAHSRGFEFYLFSWNVHTHGASGKYEITDSRKNVNTQTYMYKSMKTLLETYPDLDGIGITNGENGSSEDYLWEAYGKGLYEYAKANPNRKLKLIHRWHWTDLAEIKSMFAPLFDLKNVTFEMSYKYSSGHMHSTPNPGWIESDSIGKQLRAQKFKTWLTVRNDDFYYLQWGDPIFARNYVNGMIGLGDDIFSGFYMGSDGYTPTRNFFSKNIVEKDILEIQRQWYMFMLWGRLSYNPNTSDEVFKNYIALNFPTVSSGNLFKAWSDASKALPKVTELIQGSWQLDYKWYPEFNYGRTSHLSKEDQFRTIQLWSDTQVAEGSSLCSIEQSAANKCGSKKTSFQLADEIEADATSALSIVDNMVAESNTKLGITINNIKAMSYLANYYAYKIRGATYLKEGVSQDAKKIAALGQAYCWWMEYAKIMDSMYTGMKMVRVYDFDNWHDNDANVLKEYSDNGGVGIPSFK